MRTQYQSYQQAVENALRELRLLQPSRDNADTQPLVTEVEVIPPQEGQVPQPLRSSMLYSLALPGKRLRPVLLLAAYALLSEDWQRALPFACAVEMIHTYSLVHDDLPALDNDEMRRGKPTNHRVFGEDIAILAGDGLLNMAYETMLSAPYCQEEPLAALAACREIAIRAGVRGMIAGQTLDVKLEGTVPMEAMVRYIHRHKTADLITAPAVAGILLAGGNEKQQRAAEEYGQNLGIAFQMVDDLLDTEGDAETMGKATGMDAARGKMTWPKVYGIDQTRQDANHAVERAIAALDVFGSRGAFLRTLAQETLVRVK